MRKKRFLLYVIGLTLVLSACHKPDDEHIVPQGKHHIRFEIDVLDSIPRKGGLAASGWNEYGESVPLPDSVTVPWRYDGYADKGLAGFLFVYSAGINEDCCFVGRVFIDDSLVGQNSGRLGVCVGEFPFGY